MGLTGRLIGFEVREKKGTGFVRCGFSKTLILENHRRGFSPGEMDRVLDYAQDNKLDMIIRHPCNFGNEDARYVELKLVVTDERSSNEEQGLDFWSTVVKHGIRNLMQHKPLCDGLVLEFRATEIEEDEPVENGFNRTVLIKNILTFPDNEAEELYRQASSYAINHGLDLVIRSPKAPVNEEQGRYLEMVPLFESDM